jgi:Arf-GAP/Rho-GAP domain/ANK repeat/PH domain-containing protein 3
LRVFKAHGIGPGKLIPWKSLFIKHQGPTNISLVEGHEFFKNVERKLPIRHTGANVKESESESDLEPSMFLCPENGCTGAFDSFSVLELHIDLGVHECNTKMYHLYDAVRLDWAKKFSSIDAYDRTTPSLPTNVLVSSRRKKKLPSQKIGWALAKPRTGSSRFSDKVRKYLTTKFEVGEKTGRKADPNQVSLAMRNARNETNERLFKREEWLSKTQITGFFSRLASRQRSRGLVASSTKEQVQSDENEIEDIEADIRENDRCMLIDRINDEIGLKHPVTYDAYDLCDYYKRGNLDAFNVAMLKTILSHFEVSYRSKDRKVILVGLLKEVIEECDCCKVI